MLLIKIFALFAVAMIIYGIYRMTLAHILFKHDRNPFRRVCKRCNQLQEMYQSNIEGCNDMWWENMGTQGDAKCKCQSFASYR
jgi:hypothetical protein